MPCLNGKCYNNDQSSCCDGLCDEKMKTCVAAVVVAAVVVAAVAEAVVAEAVVAVAVVEVGQWVIMS